MDRWFNFLSEFRGSQTQEEKNSMHQECRFHDMRNRDWIWTVRSRNDLDRWSDLSWSFGDHKFKRQRTQCIKNADFAICEITIESGPSDQEMIWTVDLTSHGVSGIGICKWQKLWTPRIPILRYVKSRLNHNHWIEMWSGPLIRLLYGVSRIGNLKWQKHWTSRVSKSRWVKSWLNLNHQILMWSGSLIRLLYGILWIGICKWKEHWT